MLDAVAENIKLIGVYSTDPFGTAIGPATNYACSFIRVRNNSFWGVPLWDPNLAY